MKFNLCITRIYVSLCKESLNNGNMYWNVLLSRKYYSHYGISSSLSSSSTSSSSEYISRLERQAELELQRRLLWWMMFNIWRFKKGWYTPIWHESRIYTCMEIRVRKVCHAILVLPFISKMTYYRDECVGWEYVTMSVGFCLQCGADLRCYADPIDGSSLSSWSLVS